MKPAAIDEAIAAASITGTKIKARVLLRVKRRRPSPTTTATALPPSTNDGGIVADNSVGGAIIAPDRIQLVLPSSSSSTSGGGSRSKRRKVIDKREELALVQGFESAVSLHPSVADSEQNDTVTAAAAGTTTTTNSLLQTPSRGRIGSTNHNIPTTNDTTQAHTMHNDLANENSSTGTTTTRQDETPAPPTKPKRRAIFRKITDLQKRLDPTTMTTTKPTPTTENNEVPMPLVPFSKENVYSAASMEAAAAAETSTTTTTNWSSKGEEKSKWLRIVDVLLKEDEDDEEVMEEENDTRKDIIGVMDSSGQGVRRTRRLHDTTENDRGDGSEVVAESFVVVGGGGGGEGQQQRKKRRKLELVVEQSRTILESDFWNQQAHDVAAVVVGAAAGNNSGNNDNNSCRDNHLDPETIQLIDYSLTALHQQGGGSVMPHLSYLRNDPRLCYHANTPRGRRMINHSLSHGVDLLPSSVANGATMELDVGKGRTVLHIAALWGDLGGVRASLEMGADPTIFDASGYTPTGLARKGGYENVAAALVEGEKKALDDKNIRVDGNMEEEYYYDVYCLEEEADEVESKSGDVNTTTSRGRRGGREEEEKKSRYLQLRDGTPDSIPDLEHSTNLSEDDNDTNSSSGNLSRWASSLELQKGFGYWNEQGELILEVAGGGGDTIKQSNGSGGGCSFSSNVDNDRIIQRYYQTDNLDGDDSMGGGGGNDDDHDSNDEGYDGNDYPDDDDDVSNNSQIDSDDYDDYRDADACIENSSYCSDDSGDDDWKLDFRNRFTSKNDLDIHEYGCIDD
jgi:hypothetical protein